MHESGREFTHHQINFDIKRTLCLWSLLSFIQYSESLLTICGLVDDSCHRHHATTVHFRNVDEIIRGWFG